MLPLPGFASLRRADFSRGKLAAELGRWIRLSVDSHHNSTFPCGEVNYISPKPDGGQQDANCHQGALGKFPIDCCFHRQCLHTCDRYAACYQTGARARCLCSGFHFNRDAMVVTLYLGGFYTAQFLALSRHCQALFAEASSR